MALPLVHAATNNEYELPTQQKPSSPAMSTANRRVLGDVSPNVKLASPAMGALKTKPTNSSPLKRSFTAMAEEGAGFTYLKKRRVSLEESNSLSVGPVRSTGDSVSHKDESIPARSLRILESDEAALGATLNTRPMDSPTQDTSAVPVTQERSPTEPNTPSDNGEEMQGSSVDRKSFSSLINYDPSSQQQQQQSKQQQQSTSNLVFEHPSKAEMLRLRLRVAMYKVRTNQVDVPFDQLNVEGERVNKTKTTSEAVEEAVAQLRREAQEEISSSSLDDRSYPRLLPAPVLRPTAYSSRMIYEQSIPFEPPAGPSARGLQQGELATPGRQQVGQLSSPPDSVENGMRRRIEDGSVAGNMVTGHVAAGLLGLRNAA